MPTRTVDNWSTSVDPYIRDKVSKNFVYNKGKDTVPYRDFIIDPNTNKITAVGELISRIRTLIKNRHTWAPEAQDQAKKAILKAALERQSFFDKKDAELRAKMPDQNLIDLGINIPIPDLTSEVTPAEKFERNLVGNIIRQADQIDLDELSLAQEREGRESKAPNSAIMKMETEFFSTDVIYYNVTKDGPLSTLEAEILHKYESLVPVAELLGLQDREKLRKIKYRYIESAMLSMLFRDWMFQLDPITLKVQNLTDIIVELQEPGGTSVVKRSVPYSELISALPSGMEVQDRIELDALVKRLQESLAYIGAFTELMKAQIGAPTPYDYLKTIPDTTESQYFDEGRRKVIASLAPLMARSEKVVGGNKSVEWEVPPPDPEIGEVLTFYKLIGKAQYEIFRKSRYYDGFYLNTVALDLVSALHVNPGDKVEDLLVPNWRLPNNNGQRQTLIEPMIFITPQEVSGRTLPPGKAQIMPAVHLAKPGSNTRTVDHFKQGLPEAINTFPTSLSQRTWPTPMHSAVGFAHILSEVSHYSANTDNALLDDSADANVPDANKIIDPRTSRARKVPEIEGIHPSQKLNGAIPFKYAEEKHDGSPGRFGDTNMSLGGLLGPLTVPSYYEDASLLMSAPDPRNPSRVYVGTIRDWIVRAKGDLSKVPWDQQPLNSTLVWAQKKNKLGALYDAASKGDFGGDITAIQEFKRSEGFVRGFNDKIVDNFANLSRIVGPYTIETYCDASKQPFAKVKTPEQVESIVARTDTYFRLVIRNAITGKLTWVDSSLYQHFQIFPHRLLNQVPSSQISQLRDPVDNPTGRHFAKWLNYDNAWEELAQMADSAGMATEAARWRALHNTGETRMPVMVVSVDPNKDGAMQVPNLFLTKDLFLNIIGTGSSRGDIFKRMNRPQKFVFGLIFSEEIREKVRYHYLEGVGQMEARKLLMNLIKSVGGLKMEAWAEKMLLHEISPSSVLNDWFSLSEIERFFLGYGAIQTIDEFFKDQDFRKQVSEIMGPIVGS